MLDSSITTFFEHDPTKLLWLTHVTSDGKVYYITSDLTRSEYQLANINCEVIRNKQSIQVKIHWSCIHE